ncbi:MAG: A24 family peptidase [Candidatus Marinimicrobia bacterium]|jgi:prepilin signal peptidase PulO-like enzyme (type II secretory pathway)|nr:A24 family peptidase [Candidatus Neomarinimicrobiota bacterium]|tara:strand:- start:2621 stop:3265 length:645 start_codon:yes stop_codon:yes gene_type:complete
MEILIPILFGLILGNAVKRLVNWLAIEDYIMSNRNIFLEVVGMAIVTWGSLNLDMPEAIVFSVIAMTLAGISVIDYHTFQVPLIFIIIGVITSFVGILFDVIFLSAALWGIFVGAFIPLVIVGILWSITKRQGMGYGDIQMGIVLGAWLGPMRMALTLFGASVLSLLAWIGVSLIKGFDKDRAIPLGPFLSFAGTGAYIGSFYYPEFFHLLMIQ